MPRRFIGVDIQKTAGSSLEVAVAVLPGTDSGLSWTSKESLQANVRVAPCDIDHCSFASNSG